MFINNKYTKWYYAIIKKAQSSSRVKLHKQHESYIYYESHHIIPRALAPELIKDITNVVLLTAREHFICHCLLTKMLTGRDKYKMQAALRMLCGTKTEVRYTNSRLYQQLRKNMRLTEEHKQKLRGRIVSEETRKKISEANKGKPSPKKGLPGHKLTEEAKQEISARTKGELNPFYGRQHSEETKQKMKDSWERRRLDVLTCAHCNKTVHKSMHARWHGDNCKLLLLSQKID